MLFVGLPVSHRVRPSGRILSRFPSRWDLLWRFHSFPAVPRGRQPEPKMASLVSPPPLGRKVACGFSLRVLLGGVLGCCSCPAVFVADFCPARNKYPLFLSTCSVTSRCKTFSCLLAGNSSYPCASPLNSAAAMASVYRSAGKDVSRRNRGSMGSPLPAFHPESRSVSTCTANSSITVA